MKFNEDTRVKIPAIITLTRLGYKYLSLKNLDFNSETNIVNDIFAESIKNINKGANFTDDDIKKIQNQISVNLSADDLGRSFYNQLTNQSDVKLIDFEDFTKNNFNVVTEYTCKNGEDEFRPDITLLINGMPLAFIEVKKPNNREGIIAERDRIGARFKNQKFRKFINLTQIMVFSNNMQYCDDDIEHLEGAYYCTSSKTKAFFNHFREENAESLFSCLSPEDEDVENFILKDTNYSVIKSSSEYQQNKLVNTPTNSIILSLFSKNRLKDFLKYALAYVEYTDDDGKYHLEKHIMRYPQFFATKAIESKLERGIKRGIVWHTQGSGKTALAYFNIKYLTDYFQKQNKIPQFYFIVDRLDLKNQALDEFAKRGLKVSSIDTREAFVNNLKKQSGDSSQITVLNIHKFTEDSKAIKLNDYALNTQRIYFIDEAHRSYNPKGSFLANLNASDPNAIIISLTGTPLLSKGKRSASTDIFGDYIHQYYYNQSTADGYTLRLIREDIETQYKMELKKALADLEIEKGSKEEKQIYAHEKYVSPMLKYIVTDLEKTRIRYDDDTIGGMVVCHSSEQAKALEKEFNEKYKDKAANKHSPKSSSLILCDVEDKDFRKDEVKAYKKGKIDLLFVYNMLLTGFDAPRLKKLYLNRQVKEHNLLQTLTRVNRPYKAFRYGFVVDFADIRGEFDKANQAYWRELQQELGDVTQLYSSLFKTEEDIKKDIVHIKDVLWNYDTDNLEEFSAQITAITDKSILLDIKKALSASKELYNLINLFGYDDLLNKLDFHKLRKLAIEVENRINLINLKENLENKVDNTSILNEALEDVFFAFIKTGEKELKLADDLRSKVQRTREALKNNIDSKSPEWILLKDRLKEIFENKNFEEITEEEIRANIRLLDDVYEQISELNRKNSLLQSKYNGDSKFVRLHNRFIRERILTAKESQIFDILSVIKSKIDDKLLNLSNLLSSEGYFAGLVLENVANNFLDNDVNLTPEVTMLVRDAIVTEYMNEQNEIGIL